MQGRVNLAGVLAAIGAGLVLVGLSLDWFEPGISAWTAFELVDVLVAALALAVLAGTLSRTLGRPGGGAGAGWIPGAALAGLVLVVASIASHPPAAIDRSLENGAWVSLAGAIVLVIAAILSTTELSVVVTMRPRERRPGAAMPPAAAEEGWAGPADDPFGEPPDDEPVTDESPVEPEDRIDELADPVEEGVIADDGGLVPPEADSEPDDEAETRPFPRPRPSE